MVGWQNNFGGNVCEKDCMGIEKCVACLHKTNKMHRRQVETKIKMWGGVCKFSILPLIISYEILSIDQHVNEQLSKSAIHDRHSWLHTPLLTLPNSNASEQYVWNSFHFQSKCKSPMEVKMPSKRKQWHQTEKERWK